VRRGGRAAVVGAVVGAASLAPAVPASADEIHRDGASHEEVTLRAPIGATFVCYVDYWSSLNFTTGEFRSWVEAVEGPTECFFGDATVTVHYTAGDGTERSASASGRGAYASLSVPDVADPYPSRSYRAELALHWTATDTDWGAVTNPK
jgi:hypothetical protein